ncbi:hypothetical protein Tco_0126543 [Tanacetum coccineum]
MPESSHAHFSGRSHPQRRGLPIIIIIAIFLRPFMIFGVFAFLFDFYKYLKEKRSNKQLYQELGKYDNDRKSGSCAQMMKGSDIGIQEKKAKLFNEWERFTSTDGESIESYYHRFSKLMNDFKRNKHFPEKKDC